ncbi:hypothetical protein BE221DRAFT_68321 [Ostreococcus tauri]|uniref:Uncharacterized protein n=1 Tax=Ostreococcus tauri TaxID=70448 RepID=A0A1Y5IMR2_OSTTA|nr:hypothetical protein BE221DRAFT_68321 [Ostreococcus tauri]
MIEELEAYARESKVDDLFRDMMTGCFKTRPSSPATYILEYLASSHPEESLEHARAFKCTGHGRLRHRYCRGRCDHTMRRSREGDARGNRRGASHDGRERRI